MKKSLYFLLLALIVFNSCEKEDSSLIGSWKLQETNYVITPNQDFTFIDIFGTPWQGILKIDGKVLHLTEFRFYHDNVWGAHWLASEEVGLVFPLPNRMDIYYKGKMYVFEKEYTFDALAGLIKANGVAEAKNESESIQIQIEIDATMPKVELKKGVEYTVKDGYHAMPFLQLWLNSGGKMQTEYLTGDILEKFIGKWSTNGNQIKLQTKEIPERRYQFQLNSNILLLSEHKQKDAYPLHISRFSDKIEKVTFNAVFKRE